MSTISKIALVAIGVVAGVGISVGVGRIDTSKHAPGPTADSTHPSAAQSESKDVWRCPMHPQIVRDGPGTCPICGMELVKDRATPETSSALPTRAGVTIDTSRQQLIGLTTTKVERGPIAGEWRTSGRVDADPTRVRNITLKVSGYVERMYVDFVGRAVRKGDRLLSLYSPELLAAEEEYVLALTTSAAMSTSALNGGGGDLVAAARRRLALWDVPEAEIARLEKTHQPEKTITLVSPISGIVTQKRVVEGTRINAGEAPYEVSDLSEVWVMADVYEADIVKVKVGMPARFTTKSFAGVVFNGDVAFVDPFLDATTRTLKVHLHIPNPGIRLKPQMYGEVVLSVPVRDALKIPADAVVHAGDNDVIFVAEDGGYFEPRKVQLGMRDGAAVELTSGAVAGEDVVTRANFLIDSESQLRSALAAFGSK